MLDTVNLNHDGATNSSCSNTVAETCGRQSAGSGFGRDHRRTESLATTWMMTHSAGPLQGYIDYWRPITRGFAPGFRSAPLRGFGTIVPVASAR